MIGRRRAEVAPGNGAAVTIPVFTADHYGTAAFAGALEGFAVGVSNQLRPVIDARGTGRWHGWTNGLQNFRGAGPGNLGGGRAVIAPTTRLDQTGGSAVSTPVQQIFEERMASRRFS